MLALNDIESWNEAIDDLHYMATTMYGLTEDEQPAYLEVVSIDDTLVDLSVPRENMRLSSHWQYRKKTRYLSASRNIFRKSAYR